MKNIKSFKVLDNENKDNVLIIAYYDNPRSNKTNYFYVLDISKGYDLQNVIDKNGSWRGQREIEFFLGEHATLIGTSNIFTLSSIDLSKYVIKKTIFLPFEYEIK